MDLRETAPFPCFELGSIGPYPQDEDKSPPLHPMMHTIAQLVEALRYKSEGRGFDSYLSLEFLIDIIFPAALWPWG